MRLSWLFSALLFAALLAFLQEWALTDFLYWRFAWFDILMHFLGGLAAASFVIAFLHRRRTSLFLFAMVCIALGWEVFEFVVGMPREANFALDTATDLVMDALGMGLVYMAARLSIWRSA